MSLGSRGVRMMTRDSMLALALGSVLVGGCGLVIDSSRNQCESATDCAAQLGDDVNIYECVEGLCRTKVECDSNDQCVTPGKNICLQGLCVGCVVTPDCSSATAMCVDNVCIDDSWGCVNDADNRPLSTQSSASLTLRVADALTMMPVQGVTAVKLCLSSTVDPSCTQSFPASSASYNTQTGILTASGIIPGSYYRVIATPPTSSGLLPMEFFTNRTARDTENAAEAFFTPSFVLDGNTLQSPQPIDRSKALVTVRIFDCLGKPAQGVTMTASAGPPDMVLAYSDETRLPNYTLTSTTKAGIVGVMNGPTGTLTTFTVKSGTKSVITFTLVMRGNGTTTVDLFPRIFSAN
jgi:hypothetical protein